MRQGDSFLGPYHRLAVVIVLCVAAFLRFHALDQYPVLANQDELSDIYDGYSLAETGKDRANESYYVVVRAFGGGDYRPSLMAWLLAAEFKVAGYSVLKGRVLAAMLGMLSLVWLYLFTEKIAGKTCALFALTFATFSPWHALFSRIAHGGAMLPAVFLSLIMWSWARSRERDFTLPSLALLGFVTGFSVNAYQATRLTGLLVATLIAVDVVTTTKLRAFWKRLVVLVSSVGLGALPQLAFLFARPDLFFSRSQSTVAHGHSLTTFLGAIVGNVLVDFDPRHLFFSFGKTNAFTVARLLPIEAPFFLVGIFVLFHVVGQRRFRPSFIYCLMVIAVLPAALTVDNPHDLRASSFMVLAPVVSAAGATVVIELLDSSRARCLAGVGVILAVVANAGIFLSWYAQSATLRAFGQQNDLVELAEKVKRAGADCDRVFIQNTGNQPYIYLAAFADIPPAEFQRMEKRIEVDPEMGWDVYRRLGKYRFQTKEKIEAEMERPAQDRRLFVYAEQRDDPPPIDKTWTTGAGWVYFYEK